MDSERLLYLLVSLPALTAGLAIHEFAHAWAADRLGDDTPRRMGRLTLDPMAHLDPFGLVMIVLAMLSGYPLIGWARPVPFNPRNLSHPRRDAVLIAVAGPISNVLQALVWLLGLLLFRLAMPTAGIRFGLDAIEGILNRAPESGSIPALAASIMVTGVVLNILLAVFNMIPIPPLDGHWVLEGLGPPYVTEFYNSIRPFSFFILYALLLIPGFFLQLIEPFELLAYRAVFLALGVPMEFFQWTYR
ncbi:MAG: site-2 protease family protein [Armatimonadota bacterium]|nr:site-2 protease family protein [Armatimonadota bacterium]